MKIAVAAKGNQVSNHFVKCEGFRIYGFNGSTIDVLDYIASDSLHQKDIGTFLKDLDISIVIAGGISEVELKKLEALNIEVISKIKGDISEVIFALHRGDVTQFKYQNDKGCTCEGSCCQS